MNPGKAELGYSSAVSDAVTDTARRLSCDTVVFRYLPLAAKSVGNDGIRRIVDIDDVPSLRTKTEVTQEAGVRKIAKQWIAHSIANYQERAISLVDGGWVSCEDDLDIIGDGRFTVLPNIPMDALEGPVDKSLCSQNRESKSILFVGAMGYHINKVAMDWFLQDVWPLVLKQSPDATVNIAGGGLDELRRREYGSMAGVDLLGFVEDLAALYRESAMSIVPISAGAGTKIKVLESYRFGRPVVLTSHSLRGYESVLTDGQEVAVADDPAKMASSISALLDSPETRESMARSGQALVETHFGFDRFAALVADVLIPG